MSKQKNHLVTQDAKTMGIANKTNKQYKGWRPFEKAKKFVHQLGLKKWEEWVKYCSSGKKPKDIPSNPDKAYSEWISYANWCGYTDKRMDFTNMAQKKIKWKSYLEAKSLVRDLKFKNYTDFKKNIKNYYNDIPTHPENTYKNCGWENWNEFLGNKIEFLTYEECQFFIRDKGIKSQKEYNSYRKLHDDCRLPGNPYDVYKESWKGFSELTGIKNKNDHTNKNFVSYKECSQFAKDNKITSLTHWRRFIKEGKKPDYIPSAPYVTYKNNGWNGWGPFLGTYTVRTQDREYLPYDECKKYIAIHYKITCKREWEELKKIIKLPKNIPGNPSTVYKREGTWKGWGDFLNTGTIAPQNKVFVSYEIAKATNIKRNIQSIIDWEKFKNSSEYPDNYPLAPTMVYKDEWKGWAEYLGKTKIEYYSYEDCISIIHPLNLKSQKDYKRWFDNENKDIKIPQTPEFVYQNTGWISWGKYLGTNFIAHKIKSEMFLPYEEAEKYIHKQNISSQSEYLKWAQSDKKPINIPSSPSTFYKDKGWESWSSWLGNIGDGLHVWTKPALIAFLKNAEHELNNLDPVELLTIINSNNLARKINQIGCLEKLISSEAHTELRKKILTEITEKIEGSTDIEFEQEKDYSPLLIGEIKEAEKEEIIPTDLMPFNPIQDLKMVDSKSIIVSLDEENIEFLIKYRLNKLWNHVLNGEADLQELQNEYGGHNFELIKKIFFEEYNAITQIKLPDDYNFRSNTGELIEPNLMQKLTQHRLLRDKSYGNWTDTGGGKTLAAILAGRSAGAKHTLVICNNATVEGWVKSVNEYFLNNNIFVKHGLSDDVPKNIYQVFHKHSMRLPKNGSSYLILNYETFQQDDGEYIVSELLKNNTFNYIILDEVQNVKQRDVEKESNRRNIISKLLNQARTDNSELLILVMTATPVINNLFEARMLVELLTGVEHKELNTYANIPNGVEMYKALTRHGLRYIPKYGISVHEEIITIDGSELQNQILSIRKGDIVGFEKTLLPIKLDAVRSKIKKGTLIYTHYVTELIPEIRDYVESLGYTVGLYTGMDKDGLRQFKRGRIDVLIGSAPVGTGVDGIQKICNTLIPVCLPWTNSEWRQIKGRIDRQGSHFKDVNIYIPQVVIPLDEGKEWSWDKKRFNIIRYKATLADLAVDGRIPDKLLPSKSKMLEDAQKELREWVQRLESGNLITFERSELQIPLNPELAKKEQRVHGDFSRMNQRWSVSKSSTTYERLKHSQDEWYYYHTLYSEKRKTWSEIPYIEISKKIQTRPEWVVGDFGCGENLLAQELKNKVHAFDFVAINDSVTACDISNVPLKDNTLDVAVFSLSLMGDNYKDFLKEAYRVLKPHGNIFVSEPAEKWLGREHELKTILEGVGFKCFQAVKNTGKFIYFDGVKY